MTFIPSVLTKYDANNSNSSFTSSTFIGTSSSTIGYDSIIVNVSSASYISSIASGLKIFFSDDNSTFQIYYSDTINNCQVFTKTYPIIKNYFKIEVHFNATVTANISTRISTLESDTYPNTINAFVNKIEQNYDAFGKLRVVNPSTLMDLRVPGQSNGATGSTGQGYLQNMIQYSFGASGTTGGTGYKTAQDSKTVIYVSGNYTATNQSRKYCTYQPGKSLLMKCTGVMDGGSNTVGMISKIGYFDNQNGVYFKYTANGSGTGHASVVVLNNGISANYDQSDWNIDPMDGSGNSGIQIDWTTAQLFVIDMEWLGVGRIRFGFYAYGKIQYCHEILNINTLIAPFTSNINLPIRYQLIGNNGSTGTMIQICSTLISEGGYEPIGRPFSYSQINVVATASTSVEQYLFFLQGGGSNYYHQQIIPNSVSIASSNTTDIFSYYIKIWFPDYITNNTTTWQTINNLSVSQIATSASFNYNGSSYTSYNNFTSPTSISPIYVDTQVAAGRGSSSFSSLGSVFNDLFQITSDLYNNSAIMSLSVIGNFAGNSKLYFSFSWNEVY